MEPSRYYLHEARLSGRNDFLEKLDLKVDGVEVEKDQRKSGRRW